MDTAHPYPLQNISSTLVRKRQGEEERERGRRGEEGRGVEREGRKREGRSMEEDIREVK